MRRYELDSELRNLVQANDAHAAGAAYIAIVSLDREDTRGIASVAKGFRDLLDQGQMQKLEKLNEAQELAQVMRSAECENLSSRPGYSLPEFMNSPTCPSPLT